MSSHNKSIIGRLLSTLIVVAALISIVAYSYSRSSKGKEKTSMPLTKAGGTQAYPANKQGHSRGSRKKLSTMGMQTKRGESTVPVKICRVAQQRIEEFREATCNLEAEKEVSVVAKTSEEISKIFVEEGDRVKQGQILAKINDEKAKMAYEQARVKYENAKMLFDRAKQTYEKGILSDEGYENARLQYETAKIDYDQKDLELKYTSIKAPFDGIITNRRIEVGNHVTINQEVFTIADLDPLLARIYLPEKEWNNVEEGDKTKVTVDAFPGKEFVGVVQRISPIVERETGTFKITVEIHDKENLLRPGMLASVSVITDSRDNALVIPKKALVLESESDEVFVLRDYVKLALSQRITDNISVGDAAELKVEPKEEKIKELKKPKTGNNKTNTSPSLETASKSSSSKLDPPSASSTGQNQWHGKRTKIGQWGKKGGFTGKPPSGQRPVTPSRQNPFGKQTHKDLKQKTPEPNTKFTGSVYDVKIDEPDPETGKITVIFELDKEETGLQSGMKMSGEVKPAGKEKPVRIPATEIEVETKAFKKKIKLGFDESDPIEVLDGLSLGERIITVGHEDLREGTTVTVISEETILPETKEKKQQFVQKSPKPPPSGGMRRGRRGGPSPEQIKMFLKMRVGDPQFQQGLLKIETVKKEYSEKLKADPSLATDGEKRKAFFAEMLDKHISEILKALRKMRGAGRRRGGPR